MKRLKFITKKMLLVTTILAICITSINIVGFSTIFAEGQEAQLILQFNQISNELEGKFFKVVDSSGKLMGKIGVQDPDNSGEYLTPNENSVSLATEMMGYNIRVDFIPETGYEVGSNVIVNGHSEGLPGAETNGIKSFGIDITNQITIFDANIFQLVGTNNPPAGDREQHGEEPGGGPTNNPYEVAAYFEGITTPVNSQGGVLVVPDNWTKGIITFFARTCKIDGVVKPFHEGIECDENSYEEVRLGVEGVANGGQLNRTAIGNKEKKIVTITEDFANYGKAVVHLEGNQIGAIISVTTKDLIYIRAEAKLGMTYSLGSVAVDNTLLTNKDKGDVSIFFGNTEARLVAEGTNVKKIAKVVGGEKVTYEDGTAIVKLPALSKELITKVVVTLEMKDGKTVEKTINIIRTAITLGFNRADGDATLQAGYVFNKAYLYNNKNHDDKVFDAYLQIILYKDDVVAGYKQVKIDDEKLINKLTDNESGAIELVADNRINLYGKQTKDTIEGVNRASVFLTNGPVSFDSDTLPSVEFGIGSGVTIDFGGEK